MTYHRYKDWPRRHRRLLQCVVAVVALFLLGLWLQILPLWQHLQSQSSQLDDDKRTWEKSAYPMNADELQAHLDDCDKQLRGSLSAPGLIQISKTTLDRASSTFRDDIRTAYPVVVVPAKSTPEQVFVANANRIDFKDLYDRVATWLAENGIRVSMASMRLDENGTEPVYQQILKMWTIRNLTRIALAHHLKLVVGRDGQNAVLNARHTIAYVIGEKDKAPYLLEFPICLKLAGTMENFLAFTRDLQTDSVYIPMKHLVINTVPPTELPPGESRRIENLNFMVVCSSFFRMPDTK